MVPWSYTESGLGIPLNAVDTTSIVLGGMVTCETVSISICGGGNLEIWLMCNGIGAGCIITMIWVLGVGLIGQKRTNQLQLNNHGRSLTLKQQVKVIFFKLWIVAGIS